MKGKVYLVGAGPGDPELLTLKAARLLRDADAVLHDELVSEQILGLIPRHAQIYNVGKRCGDKKITQSEINALMIGLAQAGLQVARLKGGDPLIFGRAGEEITALREARVDFEVVPGVTAALGAAASLQTSLTHRQASHALVLVAGHSASGLDETDWPALAQPGATVVVYMPGYDYEQIAAKLENAEVNPETACAIISKATTPEEQVHFTIVRDLRNAPLLPAPTLLMFGKALAQTQHHSLLVSIPSWLRNGFENERTA